MTTNTDLMTLTDTELDNLAAAIASEQKRRRKKVKAQEKIERKKVKDQAKAESFEDSIRKDGTCLTWLGGTVNGSPVFDGEYVHYTLWRRAGKPEPVKQLRRMCHNRRCVNPAHRRDTGRSLLTGLPYKE